ncbi:LEAF RUST 10 DISEASE-RESISTANCE LOCUS RECEPTOR-LIKE PROTEIN KINASE-like 1.2 [Juglans microcarpa x Juglans regia]|uniref:LEAF RUST 10 DISEASE-RESISTANCE LOCUS RECEPTOR-LIKE PROTEIN KINASE-like 1.2 n=1 Tax=Juglans microcarpa x Juglans regia TaxID=2249226 RepID=UPI001B7F1028|nr:LEAF RUST 10 DISEASE-RESISTANCE LOCUS RECEPTOR-LIKE PROTEIN KINASE-like 1.2 [Juglans microcarpa x Juglans regia]
MKTGVLSLPAKLMALIVLVVLLLHQTCSAKDSNRDCVPSSCGNITNISSPFRLEDDPPHCGNPSFTLSCDQHNQTVLYLMSVEHYVQEINYTSKTIRVVNSGIQKDNYSFIPRYSGFLANTPYYRPYFRETMALLNCEKRVNSPGYLNKSTCFDNRTYASNSSSSQPEAGFRYVIYNQMKAGDVEDLCQVEHIFQTSWPSVRNLLPEDPSSISCTDLRNLLLYGFELYWMNPDCGNCGIFEFREYRYCCKRHTGILGIPFWVYTALRGILEDLYEPGKVNFFLQKLLECVVLMLLFWRTESEE